VANRSYSGTRTVGESTRSLVSQKAIPTGSMFPTPRLKPTAVDLFCHTEESKDTHRVPYTEVTIHPDGAGSDPLAYVRWFKDRIVIETEMHVFATHERNQLDSMTQVTILVGRSGHFSGVLRGEQSRQFTRELIRIHIHGEPGLAAMLVWSKERHRQPLGHLVDPDLVRKEHNVKATL
jgi:hypothetical protein